MAINPELITTIRVDQLPDETLSLTNLFPHTVGTDLKSATIQELVDLVATSIGVSGGVGYLAISVTDGQQLPDVPELPGFFLCGAGTYLNINGYPDVICTDELNAVMSLTDHWQLAVGIPIVAEVGVQSVTGSAVDNTDPLNPVINEIIFGVQNIIAGTNITVDDTDPANPIISATGGGATPTLQQVLDEGNETTNDVIVKNSENKISLQPRSIQFLDIDQEGSTTLRFEDTDVADQEVFIRGLSGTMALTSDIPTNTSDLTNDGADGVNAFITALDIPTYTTPSIQDVLTDGGDTAEDSAIYFTNTANDFETTINEYGDGQIFFRSVINDGGTSIGAGSIYVGNLSGSGVFINKDHILVNSIQYPYPSGASSPLATLADITGGGGVTSVGLTMPSAFSVTNSPITSSGDIAVSGAGLVSQYVRGDGTLANFPNSTGGGSSVNYYLNGSVSQGTFGGDTYYQMSKTPILGAGTNFTRTNGAGNGYIASFITDAGDPSFLNIPGGNWNVEFYFQSSSTGGSPQFYAEVYKVSATNVFTLVASGSANPEGITNGTTVDQYFTSIPVPQTSLLITDRLAVRIYVITSGKTITLHTENGNLCEVLTTFTTGLTALNGLTAQVQNLAVGTSGTDFAISSATDTHTFNLPTASATNRGALSSTDWSTFNGKQNVVSGVSDTEIGYLDGVTSAIQTQLNARCQSLYNLTSQITHTGTTAKTLLFTYFIPANTFTNGDFLNFSAMVTKAANIGNTTHTIEINTTNTFPTGATIISTAGLNTVNSSMKFKREIALTGGNGYILNVSAATPNDQTIGNISNAMSTFTYNLAADLYLFVTCTLTNATDSITYRGVSITKN